LYYKNQYNPADCIIFFSYLSKGIVERLEVVNKKWVRVKLLQGNTVDGSVSFYQLYDLKVLVLIRLIISKSHYYY
jgi:hypothetical protein